MSEVWGEETNGERREIKEERGERGRRGGGEMPLAPVGARVGDSPSTSPYSDWAISLSFHRSTIDDEDEDDDEDDDDDDDDDPDEDPPGDGRRRRRTASALIAIASFS